MQSIWFLEFEFELVLITGIIDFCILSELFHHSSLSIWILNFYNKLKWIINYNTIYFLGFVDEAVAKLNSQGVLVGLKFLYGSWFEFLFILILFDNPSERAKLILFDKNVYYTNVRAKNILNITF